MEFVGYLEPYGMDMMRNWWTGTKPRQCSRRCCFVLWRCRNFGSVYLVKPSRVLDYWLTFLLMVYTYDLYLYVWYVVTVYTYGLYLFIFMVCTYDLYLRFIHVIYTYTYGLYIW